MRVPMRHTEHRQITRLQDADKILLGGDFVRDIGTMYEIVGGIVAGVLLLICIVLSLPIWCYCFPVIAFDIALFIGKKRTKRSSK